MRRVIKPALLIMAIIFMISCNDGNSFTIGGRVVNAGKVVKIYLMEADSTGDQILDSTNLVKNNAFAFRGKTICPNLYKLKIGGLLFNLIVKNGDHISFQTDLKDPGHRSSITGSPESLQLQGWNEVTEIYALRIQGIMERYQHECLNPNANKDSLFSVYSPKYENLEAELGTKTLEFVRENTTSLAGFSAVSALDPKRYETELVAYADAVPEELKGTPSVLHFLNEIKKVKPVSVGQSAPDFQARAIDGRTVKLTNFKGKYVLVDFWASWCPPCRVENPNLVKVYDQFHSKGLQLLGVSLDAGTKEWQTAINTDKLDWMQVSDQRGFDGAAEKLYHIESIPANFIIDPRGKIIARNLFGNDLTSFLLKIYK